MFDRSITEQSHDGHPGDLAVLFDSKRKFLAIGLYDPESPIRVKVLHHGDPTTIDDSFWHDRVRRAVSVRAELIADPATTGYRLINGENDQLPGLIVDQYETTLVIKIYSAAWFPHLSPVIEALAEAVEPTAAIVRLSRLVHRSGTAPYRDGQAIFGRLPDRPITFLEHGLRFEADVVAGQKTGHFLDQRDNRARVGDLSFEASVLDVFSCTGGFAVHAAAGGARLAHRIDISPAAIAIGDRNIAANPSACRHESTTADAYEALNALAATGRRFDIVVVDPPSFAKRQSEVRGALEAYARLTNAGLRVLERGGLLVQASCSSRVTEEAFETTVTDAARRSGRTLDIVARAGHAVDHPVGFTEGRYLKAIFAHA